MTSGRRWVNVGRRGTSGEMHAVHGAIKAGADRHSTIEQSVVTKFLISRTRLTDALNKRLKPAACSIVVICRALYLGLYKK